MFKNFLLECLVKIEQSQSNLNYTKTTNGESHSSENSDAPNLDVLESNTSRRRTWQRPAPLKFNSCLDTDIDVDKNPSPTSPSNSESEYRMFLLEKIYLMDIHVMVKKPIRYA